MAVFHSFFRCFFVIVVYYSSKDIDGLSCQRNHSGSVVQSNKTDKVHRKLFRDRVKTRVKVNTNLHNRAYTKTQQLDDNKS